MSFVFAIFLQAAGYLPVEDVVGADAREVAQVYWDCALERVDRFEKSGESAHDIARAALTVCDTLDVELKSSIVVHQLAKSLGASRSPDNDEISARVANIMQEFRSDLLNRARLRVVQIRTRRALGER